jgi:putative transposase
VTPTVRRETVGVICQAHHGVSQRFVCAALGWSRTSVRYRAATSPLDEARELLAQLALEHPSWGYRRLWVVLKRKCPKIGRPRFRRLYAELRLGRKRNPRRRPTPRRKPATLPRATEARQSYAFDFMHHVTTSNVGFRVLVVVDEFTRELLALRVARSFTSSSTTRVLADVFAEYGIPQQVRCDNGSEFVSKTTAGWLRSQHVQVLYSRPAKPCDNGLCESTNGKIRDELLAPNLFHTVNAAADAAAAYRNHYNDERPHSALRNLTPNQFYVTLQPAETVVQPGPKM